MAVKKKKKEKNYTFFSSTITFLVISASPPLFPPSNREFAKTIKRPFSVYYNPYTQSIDLLKDTRGIEDVVQDLRSDLNTVCDALGKMNTYLGI